MECGLQMVSHLTHINADNILWMCYVCVYITLIIIIFFKFYTAKLGGKNFFRKVMFCILNSMLWLQTRENAICYLKNFHKIEVSHQHLINFEYENIVWWGDTKNQDEMGLILWVTCFSCLFCNLKLSV